MSMFEVTVRSTRTDTFTHHPEYVCNGQEMKKKIIIIRAPLSNKTAETGLKRQKTNLSLECPTL